MAEYQSPGGPFINETASGQYQSPGGPFINETSLVIVSLIPTLSLANVTNITTNTVKPQITLTY